MKFYEQKYAQLPGCLGCSNNLGKCGQILYNIIYGRENNEMQIALQNYSIDPKPKL